MKYWTLSAILISCVLIDTAHPASPDIERQADNVVKNWKSVKPEFLRDVANASLSNVLRKRAKSVSQRDVRALLLKLDDPEFTSSRLREFKSERQDDGPDIIESGNPKLILGVADAVFKEESAEIQKIPNGDEVRTLVPVSVRAAYAIRGLILTSPVFNLSVKTWAQSLRQIGSQNAERTRAEVRNWLTANRRFLEAEHYAAIKAL